MYTTIVCHRLYTFFSSYVWNNNTPLIGLLRKFATDKSIVIDDYQFRYKDVEFAANSTPNQLRMKDGEYIGVLLKVSESESETTTESEGRKKYVKTNFDNIPEYARNLSFNLYNPTRAIMPGMCELSLFL